jgi:O-antigen/teichoic acid export membrane protein
VSDTTLATPPPSDLTGSSGAAPAATALPARPPLGKVSTRRIVSGSLWGTVGQMLPLAASFVATPFVVHLMGKTGWGLLFIVNSVLSYTASGDLGMGVASTKFAAEAFERGDAREESAVVWTALLVMLAPTTLLAVLLFAGAPLLADLASGVPASYRPELILALRLASLLLIARSVAGVLNTPHTVRLRLDLVSLITYGANVIQVVSIPIVLWLAGGGVATAIVVMLGATVGMMVAHGLVGLRMLPELRTPHLDRALAWRLLAYGGSTMAMTLVTLLTFNVEKLLVARYASLDAVTHYGLAFQLANLLRTLPGALGSALLPSFARQHAVHDAHATQQLFDRSIRWLVLASVPAAVMLSVLADAILRAWVGASVAADGASPLSWLAFGFVANALCFVPLMLLQGIGRVDLIVKYFAILVIPYAIAVAIGTSTYGVTGTAVVWTARAVAECLLMLYAARQAVGIVPTHMRAILWSLVPSAVLLVLLWLTPAWATDGRLPLIATLAIAGALYVLLTWMIVLTREERQWLARTGEAAVSRLTGAAAA